MGNHNIEFDFKTLRNGGPLELCWKGSEVT